MTKTKTHYLCLNCISWWTKRTGCKCSPVLPKKPKPPRGPRYEWEIQVSTGFGSIYYYDMSQPDCAERAISDLVDALEQHQQDTENADHLPWFEIVRFDLRPKDYGQDRDEFDYPFELPAKRMQKHAQKLNDWRFANSSAFDKLHDKFYPEGEGQ